MATTWHSDSRPIEGMRVLLAEDNVVNEKVAVHLLRRLGCDVDAVPNGVAAVNAVIERPYDVILMDLQMPELDGWGATAKIRQLPSPGRSLPIIAVTANDLRSDWPLCVDAGMDDYLPKPVTGEGLCAILVKWDGRAIEEPTFMQPQSNFVIYDPSVLGASFGDDGEFVASVLEEFLHSAAQQIDVIASAQPASDIEAIVRAAHTLKGSARTVGALRLAEVGAEFEVLAGSGQIESASAVVGKLREEYRLLREELQHLLSSAA